MEFHKVADPGALNEAGDRLHVVLEGRYVSILRVQGKLYCIDSVCFHAGGPLTLGDIEEINGHICLVCPWHCYQISLGTGEKFYQEATTGPDDKLQAGGWKSVGQRQRTHAVEERESGLYVSLNTEGQMQSDEFACRQECGDRILRNVHRIKPPAPGMSSSFESRSRSPGRCAPSPPRSPSLKGAEDVWPEDLVPEPHATHSKAPRT